MTHVDLHPEELFDRLRAGSLGPDERRRLDAHCGLCLVCTFELQLIESARFEPAVTSAQLDRLADNALRNLALPPRAAARRAPERRQSRMLAAVAALAVLGSSFGVAAFFTRAPERFRGAISAWLGGADEAAPQAGAGRPLRKPGKLAADAAQSSAEVEQAHAPLLPAANPAPEMSPVVLDPQPASQLDGDLPNQREAGSDVGEANARKHGKSRKRVRGHTGRRDSRSMLAQSDAPQSSAFSDAEADPESALAIATRTRARGQLSEAARRYRDVIDRYPSTRAAGAAEVALGRMLYAELAQPREALRVLDAYLRRGESAPLVEEVLYYRALSLQALGQHASARVGFMQLLERFPGSLYAAQARSKLAGLRE